MEFSTDFLLHRNAFLLFFSLRCGWERKLLWAYMLVLFPLLPDLTAVHIRLIPISEEDNMSFITLWIQQDFFLCPLWLCMHTLVCVTYSTLLSSASVSWVEMKDGLGTANQNASILLGGKLILFSFILPTTIFRHQSRAHAASPDSDATKKKNIES